ERAGQTAKELPVAGVPPIETPRPGVRGLVPERVFLLRGRQVRRDHDRVRRAVDDLAARQLAPRKADPRRSETEAKRKAVVQALEPGRGIGLGDGEQPLHRNKISAAREESCGRRLRCWWSSLSPSRPACRRVRWSRIRAARRRSRDTSPLPAARARSPG